MDEKPLISIIMPALNCESYLDSSVGSVLTQTYTHWELIIVVDQKSNEQTLLEAQRLKKLAPQKIEVIKNDQNPGVSANRNLGLQRANGTWVAFIDADDSWFPVKLESQISALLKSPFKIACHSYQPVWFDSSTAGAHRLAPQQVSYDLLLQNNVIGCSTVMAHKSVLEEGFLPLPHEDYRLWLKIARKTPFLGLPQVLSTYRVGHESASSDKMKSAIHRLQILLQEPIHPLRIPFIFLAYLISGLKKHLQTGLSN
jgi:teichuronic acid biosynthesis glycosyltransferase TuaG